MVCTVTDHRTYQNMVRSLVTHLAAPHVLLFFLVPYLDVICDQLLTDAGQHGICLLSKQP